MKLKNNLRIIQNLAFLYIPVITLLLDLLLSYRCNIFLPAPPFLQYDKASHQQRFDNIVLIFRRISFQTLKKYTLIHLYLLLLLSFDTFRYEKASERFVIPSSMGKPYSPIGVPELPAGDDSIAAPMTGQIPDDSHQYDNSQSQQESAEPMPPEIHSDTASPLSEEEEARKEDNEYKKLTEDQEMIYEKIQKIRPSELLPGNEGMPDAETGISRSLHEEVHHNEKRTKTGKKEEGKKDSKKEKKVEKMNKDHKKESLNKERKGIVSDATSLNDASGKVPIVNEAEKNSKQTKLSTNEKSKTSSNMKNSKRSFGLSAQDKLKKLLNKPRIRRRSIKEKASKKSNLKPEKEKHQKGGRKNVVIVNRPPILYHPPPEIYHRPPIVLHRPPILVQRPAIVYHQPPVIVHRPAVLYRQPPLVFHQPPPVVSQPMLHSHDMFTTKPSLYHTHSRVVPAGTLFGLPHASRWSPAAQTVVDAHDSLVNTGSILGSHDDDHNNGAVVLFGHAHTRGLELSDNDHTDDDDDDENTVGDQKSGIPKASGKKLEKGKKRGSLSRRKSHKKTKRDAPSPLPKAEDKNNKETIQGQNSTKRSETAKVKAPTQGKKGTKKDVVVNRPPIIYHPPPEIYHRPDIVIHRPPIVIHRPPIIYHQPPVIVHRPAVVYHQPPIVFHQPPPAVQQPLLYSHDTFVVHPSFVAQHLGSILRTAHHYVGPPRLLTHLGQPLFNSDHIASEHSYPQETHNYDLPHMGGEENAAIADHHGLGHFDGLGGAGHYGRYVLDGHGIEGHFGGESHFGGLGSFGGVDNYGGEGHFGGLGHYGAEGQFGEGSFGGVGHYGSDGHFGGEGFLAHGFGRETMGGDESEPEANEQSAGLLGGPFGGQYGGGIAKRSRIEHAKKRDKAEGMVKHQDIAGATVVQHQQPIHIYQNSNGIEGHDGVASTEHTGYATAGHYGYEPEGDGRYESISQASYQTTEHGGYVGGQTEDASHQNGAWNTMFSHVENEMHAGPDTTHVHQEVIENHGPIYNTDDHMNIPEDAMHVEGTPTHIVQTSQQIIHQPVIYHQDPPTELHPVYHEIESPSGHTSTQGYIPDEGSATHYIHYHPLTIHHHHIHHFHILKPAEEDTIDDRPVHINHKPKEHHHEVHHFDFVTDHDPTIKKKSDIRRSTAYKGTLTTF